MIPKLGAMGYEGVELFGGQLTGLDPAEVLDVLGEAGVTVSSAHVGIGPDGTMDEDELDRLQGVGVDTVISPMIPELPTPRRSLPWPSSSLPWPPSGAGD